MASWQRDSRIKLTKYNVEINGSNFWNFTVHKRVIYSAEALYCFNFNFSFLRTKKWLPNLRQSNEGNAYLKRNWHVPFCFKTKQSKVFYGEIEKANVCFEFYFMSNITVICHVVDRRRKERSSKLNQAKIVTEDLPSRKSE